MPQKKRFGETTLSMEDIRCLAQFIINFAVQHSLILPARLPDFKHSDMQILPSFETKVSVWRLYKSSVIEEQRIARHAYLVSNATMCEYCPAVKQKSLYGNYTSHWLLKNNALSNFQLSVNFGSSCFHSLL